MNDFIDLGVATRTFHLEADLEIIEGDWNEFVSVDAAIRHFCDHLEVDPNVEYSILERTTCECRHELERQS